MKSSSTATLVRTSLSALLLLGAAPIAAGGCSDGGAPATPVAPPCSVEMHVFGHYGDATGAARVHIERKGKMVVVLSAYQSTRWTLIADPGVEILEVYVDGWNPSTIDAPPGVPVENTSGQLDYRVMRGYAWPEAAGSGTIDLVRTYQAITGQRVTSFLGCLRGTEFTLHDNLSAVTDCVDGPASLFADPDSLARCPGGTTADLAGGVPGSACGDGITTGKAYGYDCETGAVMFLAPEASCQEVLEACTQYAASTPTASLRCVYGESTVFLRETEEDACALPDPPGGGCDGKSGLGDLTMDLCQGGPSPPVGLPPGPRIRCTEALEHCFTKALLESYDPLACTWNGQRIFTHEPPGIECPASP